MKMNRKELKLEYFTQSKRLYFVGDVGDDYDSDSSIEDMLSDIDYYINVYGYTLTGISINEGEDENETK